MDEIKTNGKIGLSKVAVKAVAFAVIGFLAIFATFFLEGGFAEYNEKSADVLNALDVSSGDFENDRSVFRFNGEEKEISSSDGIYKFENGNVWVNTILSNMDLNIVMDKVVLMPKNASFDLSFDGSKILLSVYDGDVYLGFLKDGVKTSGVLNPYDGAFMQTMLVPRDSSVSVGLSKITPKIEKLLYLKLMKEFKYSPIAADVRNSQWVKKNLNEDRKYAESVKQEVVSKILKRGEFKEKGVLLRVVTKALTFVPEKKEESKRNVDFAELNNAIYFETNLESRGEVDDFYIPDDENLETYIEELLVFSPGDPQYEIYLDILVDKFSEEKYSALNNLWQGVYRGMNVNEAKTEEAFDKYYAFLKKLYGSEGSEYANFISYQNQLIDNLLLRYSAFYEKKYFDVKNELEQEMLRLEKDAEQKRELRQAFVSNKINFLKRLMKFFFEKNFEIDKTKEMLGSLVEEVNVLMPNDGSGVAVTEVFEDKLADIGDFWGYLSTTEYHTSKTYGNSHKERYESYLEDKDKVWSFINIQEDILGESKRSEVSLLDVSAEVLAVFNANEDIENLEIGEIKDVDQRFVKVTATIGGYTFEADYDRDKGWIKDVSAFGEVVSEDAVALDALLDLMQKKFADLDVEVPKEDVPGENYAQRVARAFIAEKLNAAGFVVTLDDVSVVDELAAVYRVESVAVADKKDLELTFDFKMNGEVAINVYLKTDGVGFVLDGEYSLEDLYKMALSGDLAMKASGVSR